jgi:4-hydroxythreonine-4-phosphate dehydrogenase
VTLGLPIIRTSVDHGTAYDIAYQNKASIKSFVHAVGFAKQLIRKKLSRAGSRLRTNSPLAKSENGRH